MSKGGGKKPSSGSPFGGRKATPFKGGKGGRKR
jgi:hypothetical protein